jgi:hypothetical protein
MGVHRSAVPVETTAFMSRSASVAMLREALDSVPFRARVDVLTAILSDTLSDAEAEELGNRLGRVPHARLRS